MLDKYWLSEQTINLLRAGFITERDLADNELGALEPDKTMALEVDDTVDGNMLQHDAPESSDSPGVSSRLGCLRVRRGDANGVFAELEDALKDAQKICADAAFAVLKNGYHRYNMDGALEKIEEVTEKGLLELVVVQQVAA